MTPSPRRAAAPAPTLRRAACASIAGVWAARSRNGRRPAAPAGWRSVPLLLLHVWLRDEALEPMLAVGTLPQLFPYRAHMRHGLRLDVPDGG